MPTTLETLLDVETEIESVFATYLGTTLGLPVFKSDSDTSVSTPRIEVFATVEEMGPHQWMIPAGTYAGRRIYDQFRVSVNIDLVFSPHWNASSNVASNRKASALRGGLRRCLSDWRGLQGAFTTGGLLNLASDSLRQTAGSRTIDDAEKEETITTVFGGQFFLNTNVTPT